jgi:hypothetical protein
MKRGRGPTPGLRQDQVQGATVTRNGRTNDETAVFGAVRQPGERGPLHAQAPREIRHPP